MGKGQETFNFGAAAGQRLRSH